MFFLDWYLKYNPIIVFIIRPTLKLVDAHNHPIRGGIAAAFVSALSHYGIVLPFVWENSGLIASLMNISLAVHLVFGITILSNLLIGVWRWLTGEYGDRVNSS